MPLTVPLYPLPVETEVALTEPVVHKPVALATDAVPTENEAALMRPLAKKLLADVLPEI